MKSNSIAKVIILSCVAICLVIGIRNKYRQLKVAELKSKINFITFSKIDKAQKYSKGENVKVAVCDWLFDLRGGEASKKYINPTSMIPGQPVGADEPWHGEWMSEIVHQTAPACKIIPIRVRTANDDYQQYLIKGIRFAADQGAVAVTSSMGPLTFTNELCEAVNYAETKGTLFINVHPIDRFQPGQPVRGLKDCSGKIIYTGLVPVPGHPAYPIGRDIYVWPYSLTPTYKDGWGYSDGPPIVAGVVALIKSANPALTPGEIKEIIVKTAFIQTLTPPEIKAIQKIIVKTGFIPDGFRVLDAEAAVRTAMQRKKL